VNRLRRVENRKVMSKPESLIAPGQVSRIPAYWRSGIRHEGGVNLIQALLRNVGTCRFRCEGRNSSGGPTRMRVPMRSTGADQLVVALKSLQWGWSEGVGSSGRTLWPTSDGRSRGVGPSRLRQRLDCTSRMTGDCHVRFCEGLGVRFPRATRL